MDHGIFGPDSSKKPPQAQIKSKLGIRKHDPSPVDGTKLWDSIEFLGNGTTIYTKGTNSCIFLCIHGAGHSGFSFTLLAQEIQEFATVVAFDLRGHGLSKHQGGEEDLSIDTLVDDTLYVLSELVKKYPQSTFVILGHSLGGSVAARTSKKIESTVFAERVVGLIIVDIVEGTALEYLPFMVEILQSRPVKFYSEEEAIKWAVQSKNVINMESARISIPPQLVQVKTDSGETHFEWKNNLLKSQKYWLEWFKGLSSIFLASRYPKVCFIAARERLDKELEIANMQGKFRLVTFPNVGHCMMEDDPVSTAKNCHMILDRFRCGLSMADVEFIKEKGVPSFTSSLKKYSKS